MEYVGKGQWQKERLVIKQSNNILRHPELKRTWTELQRKPEFERTYASKKKERRTESGNRRGEMREKKNTQIRTIISEDKFSSIHPSSSHFSVR